MWVAQMPGDFFEIRVAGVLPPEALLDYESLSVSAQPPVTVLDGPLPDQASLSGLLARLELFGARLLLVRRH
jgi:hypothetical protein